MKHLEQAGRARSPRFVQRPLGMRAAGGSVWDGVVAVIDVKRTACYGAFVLRHLTTRRHGGQSVVLLAYARLAVAGLALAAAPRLAFAAPSVLPTSSAPARALSPAAPPPVVRVLSQYERDSLNTALNGLGAEIEAYPEGKRVESVEVVVLDVFEPRDPAPAFLNWFHVNTRDDLVRREVLLGPGRAYTALLAAESERNLRKFLQFSVVLVMPIKGAEPDTVRILVVTKDVWSLRLSWDPTFYKGRLTSLLLSPAELNFLGSTQTISGTLNAGPNSVSLGFTYYVPRVAGSRITSSLSANAQVNCQTGQVEGGAGRLSYGRPLFSTRTAWAWGVSSSYVNQVARSSLGAVNAICSSPGAAGVRVALDPQVSPTTFETPVAYIPNVYRTESITTQIGFTRSFFVEDKVNVSLGLEALRERNAPLGPPSAVYTGTAQFTQGNPNRTCWPPGARSEVCRDPVPATLDERVDPALVSWLYEQQRLPPSLFRVGPYVQLDTFETRYVRMLNVNTLGLQEDVQLGHDVSLRMYPAIRPLGSRNILGTIASVDYTLALFGGFFRLGGTSRIEVSGDEDDFAKVGVERSSTAETRLELRSYWATPAIGIGRFVVGTTFLDSPQWRYVPPVFELGSANRLRGYVPGRFFGRTVLVNNVEFRTRPLEFASTSLGLVAFWDAGTAGDGLGDLTLAHGVGAGLRVLLPQIDRQVFRIDLGFPVQENTWRQFTLTAGFLQVFGEGST